MKLSINKIFLFLTLFIILPKLCLAQASCLLPESDSDGDGWGWEDNTSCLITEETGKIPTFYHPRTKEKIPLEKLTWSWKDFSKKSFENCEGFVVDPEKEEDFCSTCKEGSQTNHLHLNDGNGTTQFKEEGEETSEAIFTWNVDHNGFYSGVLPIKIYGEKTPQGIRFWLQGEAGKIGFYTLCKIFSAEEENTEPEPQTSQAISQSSSKPCIDSDGDGWGWDGTKSCKMDK